MSLLDDATVAPSMGSKCWAQQLPADLTAELAEVEAAYDDGVPINQAALSRSLKSRGVEISDVGRHFRRECKCRS